MENIIYNNLYFDLLGYIKNFSIKHTLIIDLYPTAFC